MRYRDLEADLTGISSEIHVCHWTWRPDVDISASDISIENVNNKSDYDI